MVKFGCLFALFPLEEARRLQPTAILQSEEAGYTYNSSDSYRCRDGQGQPGQNYAALSGSQADCESKCDADAACMGFEFVAESSAWDQPCKLFGANVPQLGAANGTQYCLRETFASVPAKAVPGDGKFAPNIGWLAEALQVPVSTADCKQLGGGGNKGMSGAQFFKCGVEYGGSEKFPSLGVPTKLFVKMRTPKQFPDEFDVERQVYALTNHLPEKLPLPLLLSGGRNHLVQQSAGSGVDPDYIFPEAEVTALLDAYAKVHSSFWGIDTESLQLKSVEAWGSIFAATTAVSADDLAPLLQAAKLPNNVQQLIFRLGKEVGYGKALEYMRSRGQTLVQGDAHNGQVLRGPDDGSAGGTWKLADFGWAHADYPAVDIGALLPDISPKEKHEKYVKHYWQKLTESVGCDQDASGQLPSCDYKEFFMLFKLGAFFRGGFVLQMIDYNRANNPANPMPDIWDDPATQAALLAWFGVLDSETVDYLSQKTQGFGSSLLSLSELPAPNPTVLDALSKREFSLLAEAVGKP